MVGMGLHVLERMPVGEGGFSFNLFFFLRSCRRADLM